MTTNVIDQEFRKVASDSRWSAKIGEELHFVDDTHFDKIAVVNDVVMVCAGDSELIAKWKEWVAQPNFWDVQPPKTEVLRTNGPSSITVAILTTPECELAYCRGVYLYVDGAFMFTGTGWEHAMGCFRANKDIEKSVETAKADDFTGGTVRVVDVASAKGNLADPQLGFDHLNATFQQRGNIMDLQSRKIRPVRTAANDQSATQGSDTVILSAPTGHDSVPWTPEDHLRLGRALERLKNRAEAKAKEC